MKKKYLLKKLGEKKTIKDIAKENGVHMTTVMRYTHGYGIKFPKGRYQEVDHASKIGRKIGIMTIVSFDGYRKSRSNKSKIPYFKCQCDCGNHRSVAMHNLALQQSCGCLKNKVVGIDIEKSPDSTMQAFNSVYAYYRNNAVKANREFKLDRGVFLKLTSQACHYCGQPPLQRAIQRHKTLTNFYFYNGIDRMNNNIGYVIENCVTCCGDCNYSKRAHSYEYFIKYVDRIKEHRSGLCVK